MPADHGLRLNQDTSLSPSWPEPGKPYPQNAVSRVKGDPVAADLALEDEKLVAKGQHLDSKGGGTPQEVGERKEQRAKSCIHVVPRGIGPSGFLNNLGTIGFSEATARFPDTTTVKNVASASMPKSRRNLSLVFFEL